MRSNNTPTDLLSVTAATVFNTGNLTTTPTKYPDSSLGSPSFAVRRVTISNLATAAYIAFALSLTTTSPTFVSPTAGTAPATAGIPVFPLTSKTVDVLSNLSLWVVASAGSTPCQVASFDTVA